MELVNPHVTTVSDAQPDVRAQFIRNTYLHLAGAIGLFAVLEWALLASPVGTMIAERMLGAGRMGWLLVLAGFMGIAWLADGWARSSTSVRAQYAGLGLYVVAEAFLFLPLLLMASRYVPSAIPNAALVTAVLFLGLTVTAFLTRADFSFLRGVLAIGGFVALGVIVASLLFGFQLGVIFFAVMVVFAAGSILYTTSSILHTYRPDQHVAASLSLFAGIALMFWYILQIFMSRD